MRANMGSLRKVTHSGVGSASLAVQLTLDTLFSMLMRLAICSSFD